VAPVALLPANPVPVAPQIRCVEGYDHDMAGAGLDALPATGADIRLASLERVDATDLERPAQRGISAHRRMAAITAKAATNIT
jgi:hypothetical protein